MHVTMIACTMLTLEAVERFGCGEAMDNDAEVLCGTAAALCTNFKGDPMQALRGAMASGHESVIEHASYSFLVEGLSRVALAQLTRHRLMSFSVQSQRYCGAPDALQCVRPASFAEYGFVGSVDYALTVLQELYNAMIADGVPAEDARFVMPEGLPVNLIATTNARELRHVLAMRCCNRAQWEIREMAERMLEIVRKESHTIFKDAGAGCVRGKCPEGKRSCGKPKTEGKQ